jgi:predicted transcriptional regulator
MEALCDLLFELSNDDRLSILFELQKGPSKISNLSKTLDFTPQATTRNVTRLVEIGLIRRTEESDYSLTPYGSTSINLLGPYLFLTENKDYMSTHLTDKLPTEFLGRIGDLRNCERINDPLEMMSNMERVFDEAEEWHSYLSPFRAMSHSSLDYVVKKLDNGLKISNIEETNYMVPDSTLARIPEDEVRRLEEHWIKGNSKFRYLDKIDIRLNMSEKEVS